MLQGVLQLVDEGIGCASRRLAFEVVQCVVSVSGCALTKGDVGGHRQLRLMRARRLST